MGALTRAAILAANDMRVERVPVPEWAENGVTEVCVRRLSVEDFKRIVPTAATTDGGVEFALRVFLATVCDETGARLFGEDDRAALLEKDFVVLRRVADVALQFNGLKAQEGEADVGEGLKKNSPATSSAASLSG